jgi:Cu+-exporting ATPase
VLSERNVAVSTESLPMTGWRDVIQTTSVDQSVLETHTHLMYEVPLHITGMTCGGCAASLEKKLTSEPKVQSAEVNFATESARIVTEAGTSARELIRWVTEAGFSVRTHTHRFSVDTADADALDRLQRTLERDTNVINFHLHDALATLDVAVLPETDQTALFETLAACGATPTAQIDAPKIERTAASTVELWVSVALTVPLMAQMLAMWSGLDWHLSPITEWILATPIQWWIGRRFYQGALAALKRAEANMDTLVALGTSAAYGYSVFQMITLGEAATGMLYFEASAMVITLVLLGKYIETRAKHSATEALQAVLALKPQRVRILKGGVETDIAPDQVHPGDVLVIRSGERIGADGTIIKGEAEIDTSAMTGEPLPALQQTGDTVVSGTLVVNGTIRVSAERVGAASTVHQVAELVKNAQMGKAPIQKLVDRISRIFVPVVLLIASVTFIGWFTAGAGLEFALIAAISVLVIACPCALGLATPTALVAGTGLAAKHGILIKDIQTLEALTDLDVIAFDKTGTLTVGAPQVVAAEHVADTDLDFETLAHLIARESDHPLAQAIVNAYPLTEPAHLEIESVETIPGAGITVTTPTATYRLGQSAFAGESDAADSQRTRTVLSEDHQVLGWFEFADQPRAEAKALIAQLAPLELETLMLTGDKEPVAQALASELGIDRVLADLTPDQKIDAIRELQARGLRVAMVGDGINDGPALAAADVGIAMGSGSEIALKSAPVVLMRHDLDLIRQAQVLAVRTRQVIRQNLGWAFGYNVLCIPLAVSGVLTPAVAGLAMALSSVSVVANALRLKRQQT